MASSARAICPCPPSCSCVCPCRCRAAPRQQAASASPRPPGPCTPRASASGASASFEAEPEDPYKVGRVPSSARLACVLLPGWPASLAAVTAVVPLLGPAPALRPSLRTPTKLPSVVEFHPLPGWHAIPLPSWHASLAAGATVLLPNALGPPNPFIHGIGHIGALGFMHTPCVWCPLSRPLVPMGHHATPS